MSKTVEGLEKKLRKEKELVAELLGENSLLKLYKRNYLKMERRIKEFVKEFKL